MAIAFVQYTQAGGITSTTILLQFTGLSGGECVVAGVRINDAGNTTHVLTPTSVPANTWVSGPTVVLGTDDKYYSFYGLNCTNTAGVLNLTLTADATVFLRAAGTCYSGVATTSALDKTSSNSGSGTALNTGSATTTVANEVLVMIAGNPGSKTYTAGAGFTLEGTVESDIGMLDDIVSATGTYSGTATASGSVSWIAILLTFADTPVSAGTTRVPQFMLVGVGT